MWRACLLQFPASAAPAPVLNSVSKGGRGRTRHKALCHQHVLHDELAVRHHHSDGSEQGLRSRKSVAVVQLR